MTMLQNLTTILLNPGTTEAPINLGDSDECDECFEEYEEIDDEQVFNDQDEDCLYPMQYETLER